MAACSIVGELVGLAVSLLFLYDTWFSAIMAFVEFFLHLFAKTFHNRRFFFPCAPRADVCGTGSKAVIYFRRHAMICPGFVEEALLLKISRIESVFTASKVYRQVADALLEVK